MCEIKDFLINHPGISVRWIEQQVAVPLGTIRIKSDKPIPEKYINPIKDILKDYGWSNNDVQTSDSPTATYIVRNNQVGYMDGFIFRRANLKDNTAIAIIQRS